MGCLLVLLLFVLIAAGFKGLAALIAAALIGLILLGALVAGILAALG